MDATSSLTSALLPKADINSVFCDVRFVPKADSRTASKKQSLDHFIGCGKKCRRNCQAKRLGRLEVDYHFEFDRGLDGQLARLRALEDAIDVGRRAPMVIRRVISVGEQATDFSELMERIGREPLAK
jgi:hypothetical protein